MTHQICPISGESHKEERLNYWTHLLGIFLSFYGLLFLIIFSIAYGDGWSIASHTIYGVTLVLLYIVSTYYHSCKVLHIKKTLRVVDHACIFLLIAGSYTPFTLGPLRDSNGFLLLAIQWTIAFLGIILKIFAFERSKIIALVAYVAMGWMIVFSWPTLSEKLPLSTISLVASGGLLYTFGILFFLWDRLPYNHSIWHGFVLSGSLCHYYAVLLLLF